MSVGHVGSSRASTHHHVEHNSEVHAPAKAAEGRNEGKAHGLTHAHGDAFKPAAAGEGAKPGALQGLEPKKVGPEAFADSLKKVGDFSSTAKDLAKELTKIADFSGTAKELGKELGELAKIKPKAMSSTTTGEGVSKAHLGHI